MGIALPACIQLVTSEGLQSRLQPCSQGPLSSYLEKVPWFRLVTCLVDFSRDVIEGRGWKVEVCLSTLAY